MKIPPSYTKTTATLMALLPDAATTVQGSRWTVGEHIEHCLAVNMSMLRGMCDPQRKPGRKLSLWGRLVLWSGWIPRGKARAPEAVNPRSGGNPESIEKLYRICETYHNRIQTEANLNGFEHPRFGWMSPGQTLRFLAVHNNHHLKIIAKGRR
jgi:hypothetical protein